jgi:hypothetical protein
MIMSAEIQKSVQESAPKDTVKRKILKDLFNDPLTVKLDRAFMHQSFQIPGAGQESTISGTRPGTRGLEVVYHLVYAIFIGKLNGKYFLTPSANAISGHEDPIGK